MLSAYLLKTSRPAEILKAVHDAVRGISYVTPQIGRAIENIFIRDPGAEAQSSSPDANAKSCKCLRRVVP